MLTTYPITGTRHERLAVWLKFNGHTVRTRKGTIELRVTRGRNPRPLRIWLHDNGRTAWFRGDRETKRSPKIDTLMQEWNCAELYVPGASHSKVHRDLTEQPDHEVQSMADFHAANPIGLESIGQERVDLEWNARRQRLVERRFCMYPNLTALVTGLMNRRHYREELAARNLHFQNAVSIPTVTDDTVSPVPVSFTPAGCEAGLTQGALPWLN